MVKLIALKLPSNFNYNNLFEKLKNVKTFNIHKICDKNNKCFDLCLCL